jgi:hypothetical protein
VCWEACSCPSNTAGTEAQRAQGPCGWGGGRALPAWAGLSAEGLTRVPSRLLPRPVTLGLPDLFLPSGLQFERETTLLCSETEPRLHWPAASFKEEEPVVAQGTLATPVCHHLHKASKQFLLQALQSLRLGLPMAPPLLGVCLSSQTWKAGLLHPPLSQLRALPLEA